jgi:drug/metabolite transporter (DMT)-like permease
MPACAACWAKAAKSSPFEQELEMTVIDMPARPALSAQSKGLGFGLAAVAMWAAYLAFARAGVNAGLTPVDFVFLRFVTAGAIMLPWLIRKGIGNLGGVGWRRGAALALFAGPLFIALGVGGYTFAPLAHGAVVQPSALTLGAMAASWLIFGERPPRERAFGVAIILAGLVLIAIGKGGSELPGAWRGDLLFVAAGLFWVGFTILLRHWKIGGIPATAAVAVISAIIVLPAFVATQSFGRLAVLPLGMLFTQIIVQGLFSGVLAVIAYGKSVEHLGASKAALFPALVPAAALIVGVPITGEMPAAVEWLGALMATMGLAVAMGVIGLRPEA